MRSAFSSISLSSATSQPPVFGTPTKFRVFVTSPTFAVERRRDLERLLLNIRTFGRREILPLVGDADVGGHAADPLHLDGGVDDFLHESLFVFRGDGAWFLLERRRPVLGVGRHGRELHVDFLRHRAGLSDFGGDAGDPLDLGLVDDGAAGEAPDAAVNDADAKAGRAAVAPPAASTAAASASAEAAASTAESARRVAVRSAARIHAAAHAAREPDVRVTAADPSRFRQGDICESLEGGR
jgi:hypothetical protein